MSDTKTTNNNSMRIEYWRQSFENNLFFSHHDPHIFRYFTRAFGESKFEPLK